MPARWPRLVAILAILPCADGCAPFSSQRQANYQTVAADPNRDPDKAARLNERAGKLLQKSKWNEAEEALQMALIADVGYGPAHNNLGKIRYARGDYYLAAWEFEYAVKLMPDRAEPISNLGMVYEAVDRFDRAIESYTLALQMAPQNPVCIGNLARVRLKRDENDLAARDLLRDLVLYDTRPEWVQWAREWLALARSPEPAVPVSPEFIPPGPAIPPTNNRQAPPPGEPGAAGYQRVIDP
ncbi:MAG: tetratricopeptide repeat protein [Candidatus Nealsonbacteria bacterium]|nr:tetratricopeptide repeat protein [Candidatus Nealsonbacteria bacterium]